MTFFRATSLTIIAMITAGIALIVAPRPAYGCSCLEYALSDYIDDAAVIFVGRPVHRIQPNDPSYHGYLSRSDGITMIFQVEQVFKGRAGPLLAARTAFGSGDCGYEEYDMNAADTAVVLATLRGEHGWWPSAPGDLEVHYCGSWFTVNEIEEALGPGYPPDETMVEVAELLENNAGSRNGASAVTVVLLIGGAAAVLLGGAVVMRNRRRRSSRKDDL